MRNPYSEFNGTISQYKYLHKKVSDAFGRPSECEDCSTTTAKRYDWSNDGRNYGHPYIIRREDWTRLCRSCHQKRDAHLFEGKRFSGRKHTEKSKQKTRESMKKFWDDNPGYWDGKLANHE